MGERAGVRFEIPRLVRRDPDPKLLESLHRLRSSGAGTQEWPGLDGSSIGFSGVCEGRCFIRLEGVATYLFDDGVSPVEAVADRESQPEWIEDSYRRLALPLVVQVRGTQVLHASAVETGAGIVILCGYSGAGKSTLAYGLGQRGCRVWADDAVAFRVEGERIEGRPLPFRIRLLPDTAEYFLPASRGGSQKLVVPEDDDLRPRESRSIVQGYLLEPADGEEAGSDERIAVAPVSTTEAFRRLLPHGYFFHRLEESSSYRRVVEAYLELAARVPFYSATRRPGLAGLEERIEAISRHIGEAGVADRGR